MNIPTIVDLSAYKEGEYQDRIKKIAPRIKRGTELMSFASGRRAMEQEIMILQTISAAKINLEGNGLPFSFPTTNIMSSGNGGLVANGEGLENAIANRYFEFAEIPMEDLKSKPSRPEYEYFIKDGKILVMFVTPKTLVSVEQHMSRRN